MTNSRKAVRGKRGRKRGRDSSPTKVTPPRLAEVYSRPRLYSRLDTACGKKGAWISAPAGSGKTTLISSYSSSRKRPVLWYQLDQGDGDIASFFYYLGVAAKKAAPTVRRSLPLLTPEFARGVHTFARNFFRGLYKHLNPDTLLVFDNYQDAPTESPLHALFAIGLEELPAGLTTVFVSRGEPPAAFAHRRACGELDCIGWDELKFDPSETEGLARLRGQDAIDAGILEAIQQRTQGWAAGLTLLLEDYRVNASLKPLAEGGHEILFDYFAGEILQRTDPPTRDFLLKVAALPTLRVDTAAQVSGNSQAGELLSRLTEANYFTVRHQGDEPTYEFHPLFRDFLRAFARRTFDPQEYCELQRHAAVTLLEQGQALEAAELFRVVGDWEGFARSVVQHAPTLASQGRFSTIASLLRDTPEPILTLFPWLRYWLGASQLLHDAAGSYPHFARAYEQFVKQNDVVGIYLSWSAAVDAIWYQQVDFALLDPWIERLDNDLLAREIKFPSFDIEAQVVCSLIWALIWHKLDHPRMSKWVERAAELWQSGTDDSVRLRLGVGLVFYYIIVGNFTKSAMIAASQRHLIEKADISPGAALASLVMDCYVSTSEGRPQHVATLLENAQRVIDASGVHFLDCLLYGAGTMGALCSADRDRADTWLAAMGNILAPQPVNLDKAFWYVLSGWRARLDENHAAAVEYSKEAIAIAVRIGAGYPEAFCRYGLAHSYLDQGNLTEAEMQARECASLVNRYRISLFDQLLHLFDARLAFRQGDSVRGLESLRIALAQQEKMGWFAYLSTMWTQKEATDLYIKALEHDISTDFVQRLICNSPLTPPLPPTHLDNWPWPVKLRTLGKFSLHKDDTSVEFIGKSQKKPMQLLTAMLAFGGRDVPEAELTEALWPNAEGDTVAQALATTLHRLRRLIGEDAIERQEGRISLNARHVWVDAWALEHLTSQFDTDSDGGDLASLGRLTTQLMSLYRGAFLCSEPEQSWVLSRRERLRTKFLRALVTAAERLSAACPAQAVACCERAVEIEPLAEGAYRILIKANLALDRHVEAATAYKRCREALAAIGLVPSPETEALARTVRRH